MKTFIGIAVGIVSHVALYDAVRITNVPDLYSYVIGVLIARPIFSLMEDDCAEPVHAFDRAFMSVGIGVVIGRFVRTWLTTDKLRGTIDRGGEL
jgi:hypothetical protein